jgi:hypothetical protein
MLTRLMLRGFQTSLRETNEDLLGVTSVVKKSIKIDATATSAMDTTGAPKAAALIVYRSTLECLIGKFTVEMIINDHVSQG